MRALIFDGAAARLEMSHPAPVAAAGEAVIRLAKAAISRTDLELCKGMLGFKGVLGHEFVGIVESVNGQHSPNLVGKRVVGSPISACGKCDMCLAGLSGHCRHRTIMGVHKRGGCLAERFTLPVRNLIAVPDSVDNDHAVFAAELSAAMQAAGQLTIVGKPYITVLGDGSLGLLMAQVMGKLNASVRLVGRHAEKLAVCEKWGIKHRHIDDVGRRSDQDVVVDCTGTPEGLELAMQLVRPRGKIVLKSMYADVVGNSTSRKVEKSREAASASEAITNRSLLDLTPIVLNELEVIGSHGGSVSEALSLLARREIDVVSLISKRMSLSDGPALLKAAAQPEVIKVLVDG